MKWRFTEKALRKIARRAMDKGTGARGLRSIVEQVMLDIMYDLPDQPKGTKYSIEEETVATAFGESVLQLPELPCRISVSGIDNIV